MFEKSTAKTFNELQYFSSYNPQKMLLCPNTLEEITLPKHFVKLDINNGIIPGVRSVNSPLRIILLGQLEKLGYMAFGYGNGKQRPFILVLPDAKDLPVMDNYALGYQGPKCLAIYVPDESVDMYKSNKVLQGYHMEDKIFPTSQYQ